MNSAQQSKYNQEYATLKPNNQFHSFQHEAEKRYDQAAKILFFTHKVLPWNL